MLPEDDPWFAKRQCFGIGGKVVEMAKATKKEHLGKWYVQDWLKIDDAKLYSSFKSALTDYIGRCLEARLVRKEKLK